MTRFIKVVLLLFVLALPRTQLLSQDESRQFNQQDLQELRNDPSFQYELIKPEPEDFLSRLWNRFKAWFWGLFESEGSRSAIDIAVKAFFAFAFLYFLIKVLGGDVNSLFKASSKGHDLAYELSEEAIHEIDFEMEIQKASSAKNHRLVIRLYYLMALKKASEQGLITLMQGKTNRDYLYEISAHSMSEEFNHLSYLFDYTWYGHFDANEDHVSQARAHMSRMFQKGGGNEAE